MALFSKDSLLQDVKALHKNDESSIDSYRITENMRVNRITFVIFAHMASILFSLLNGYLLIKELKRTDSFSSLGQDRAMLAFEADITVITLHLIVHLPSFFLFQLVLTLETRKACFRFIRILKLIFIVLFFGCILGIGSTIYWYSRIKTLLGEGFKAGMSKYKDELQFKQEIDRLQIRFKRVIKVILPLKLLIFEIYYNQFRCCGYESYTDWFRESWMHSQLPTINSFAAVPFSCCDPEVLRPCVRYDILNDYAHAHYNHNYDLTIYKTSCEEKIKNLNEPLAVVAIYVLLALLDVAIVKLIPIIYISILFLPDDNVTDNVIIVKGNQGFGESTLASMQRRRLSEEEKLDIEIKKASEDPLHSIIKATRKKINSSRVKIDIGIDKMKSRRNF
ncbi:DgyrCDS3542 [Dimorphilus gyrociliatus]|uniref:DgyrCDS3542 n=1 Tax=Dimorphilus gyrociliatus TaxID=2664684 RepID=A0A7I8VFF8_9ANNE|nr:DgyrCDS3542 [Dimorphilus gyrociliatus]